MKKLITLFFILGLALTVQAQVIKIINITTAGTLSRALTSVELNTVTNLTLTGAIDARDFKTMRDNMPLLANLDLSNVSIVAYTGAAGTNGTNNKVYPAYEIPQFAFYKLNSGNKKASLKSISMPNSINSIGSDAFSHCTELSSVALPGSITSIGKSAFYGCTGLSSVALPGSITSIGSQAFYGCTGLSSVTLPGSITSIGSQAFYGCTGLSSVTLPGSVTSIGESAFSYCTGLSSVTLPGSVTSIGSYAFSHCTGLSSVTLPGSVTSIGGYAFYGCTGLTEFNVDATNLNYFSQNGVLFDKNATLLIQCPAKKQGTYTIPSSVTSIGESAFDHCTGLSSVTLPGSVTSIGSGAFYYCTGLSSVTLPGSITSIGSYVFYGCTVLSSVTLPGSVTSIGSQAFANCTGLTEFIVDATNLNYSSQNGVLFDKNATLLIQYPGGKQGTYTIPSSVTSIGSAAFSYCTGLSSVTLPGSLTSIGEYAFFNCTGLTSIYAYHATPVDLSNTYSVFYNVNTSTCTLYVPYGTKAAYLAANQWKDFTNIVEAANGFILSSTTVNIAATAGSTASVNVTANIAWTASSNQTWLSVSPASGTGNQSLTFTAPVNSSICTRTAIITVSATGVESQTITITQAGSDAPLAVTAGGLATALTAEELASITNLTLTGAIDARDFVTMRDAMPALAILDLSGVTIVVYSGPAEPAGVKASSSPAEKISPKAELDDPLSRIRAQQIKMQVGTVATAAYPANEIPQCAFYNPTSGNGKASLKSISMPNSITSIGNNAFYYCTGLSSVTLPGSVTSIGSGSQAFANCTGLTEFIVDAINLNYSSQNGVLFNKNATQLIQCPAKKQGTYTIPSSVTSIGSGAFSDCTGLSSVTLPGSITSIGSDAFSYCTGLSSVTIPNSVTWIGGYAFLYCTGLSSVTLPGSLTSIGEYAFFNCTGLSSVTLPGSITSIGSHAFSYCTGLSSVTLPGSITSIGSYAFSYCTGLSSVTLPGSITSIGSGAFSDCTGLSSVTLPGSLTSIGESAFFNCTGLTSIYAYPATPVDLSNTYSVFYNVNTSTCTLYVPYGSKAAYQAANQWQDFTNIVEAQGFLLGSRIAKILNVVGSSTTVEIKANVSWTASSDQSWLTVSPGSGSGNGILTFTSASQSQTLRTATVTVSSSGYASQTITVLETNSITYCTAGSTATTYEYISNVAIGSINRASVRGTAGYQNYTSQITSMQIGVNTTATITVTNPYSKDQLLIWIDWNQDGDFDEAGENVYASTGSFASPHTTANFAPPADAETGITRMRIRLHDIISEPNATSCGNSNYGEVEDYSVNVVSQSLGFEQTELNSLIKVYPNPVLNELIIEFDGSISFEILNLMGQVIYSGNLIKSTIVQTANLSTGVYLIKFKMGKSFEYKKFIKK